MKMKVPVDSIQINSGRRETDRRHIGELAASMAELGLLNPITIDQGHTLIAGLHRLEAAKLLGWTEIDCTVTSLEGLQAELAEIDENMIRHNLDYLEEGEQLARRKEIYETLHPETRQGKRNGQTSKTATSAVLGTKPCAADTAEKIGMAERTIRQKIQVATRLTPETKEIAREHKIGFKNAVQLSRLEPGQQKEAADLLAAREIQSVHEYTAAKAEQPEPEPPEIRRLVELAGFHWALGKKSGREYDIIATRAVFNAYRLLGGPDFSRMLGLLSHTWQGNPHSLTAALLSGMALFLKTYGTELDDSLFVRRLSTVDPEEVVRRGRLDYSTSNNSLRYARVLLEKYNGTRRTNKQLPYRFKG